MEPGQSVGQWVFQVEGGEVMDLANTLSSQVRVHLLLFYLLNIQGQAGVTPLSVVGRESECPARDGQ